MASVQLCHSTQTHSQRRSPCLHDSHHGQAQTRSAHQGIFGSARRLSKADIFCQVPSDSLCLQARFIASAVPAAVCLPTLARRPRSEWQVVQTVRGAVLRQALMCWLMGVGYALPQGRRFAPAFGARDLPRSPLGHRALFFAPANGARDLLRGAPGSVDSAKEAPRRRRPSARSAPTPAHRRDRAGFRPRWRPAPSIPLRVLRTRRNG